MGRAMRTELESRDILQSVLVKSLSRLHQVEQAASVMGWLARMAENEIRDRADYLARERRDQARKAPLDTAVIEQVPAPVRQALSQAILSEELTRVEAALDDLPADQRDVIVLRMLEELSFPEMAARLGKSADACRMAFARAMAALTLRLAPPRGADGHR
jgi:RNA polymerase sigma-70 factor (ECF subfamily)